MSNFFNLIKFQSGGKSRKLPTILKNIGETILDFTPVIGDIKGLTIDPYRAYKEDGWKGALSMAGLGLIGLVPGVGDVAKKAGKTVIKNADKIEDIVKPLAKKDIDKKLQHYWPKPIESPKQYKPISIKREIQRFKDEDDVKKGIPYVSETGTSVILTPKRIFTDEIGNNSFNVQKLLENIFLNAYKQAGYLNDDEVIKLANYLKNDLKIYKGDFSKIQDSISGFFNNKNTIVLNNQLDRLMGVSMHEIGHYLDKLGYWSKGENSANKFRLLEDAYQVIPNEADKWNIVAQELPEKYATNVKLKTPFAWKFYRQYKEVPKSGQISQFIKDQNNKSVLETMKNMTYADAYIENYLQFLLKNQDQIPILKTALTDVFKQGGKIDENN